MSEEAFTNIPSRHVNGGDALANVGGAFSFSDGGVACACELACSASAHQRRSGGGGGATVNNNTAPNPTSTLSTAPASH